MTRYQYNRQVEPPAPYVHVIVNRADGVGASATIPALVDSGADRTVVPQVLIDELGLPQAGVMEAVGLNHVGAMLGMYVLQIGIRDLAPVVIEVIAAPGEQYVLLGRDVLNRHCVTLDGPELLCTIE
jgi:predicted aspartyl protease